MPHPKEFRHCELKRSKNAQSVAICSRFYALSLTVLTMTIASLPTAQAWGSNTIDLNGEPRAELGKTQSKIVIPLKKDSGCKDLTLIHQPGSGQSTIQLDAEKQMGDPLVYKSDFSNRNLRGYVVELSKDGRFQMFIKHGTPNTADATCYNKQLVVTVEERYKHIEQQTTLARGLNYVQHKVALGAGKEFRTHNLDWNPQDSNVKLAAMMPNPGSLQGLRTVKGTLEKYGGIAGVNASFFNAKLKIPLGIVVQDGELLNGTLYGRSALGINDKNVPHIERVDLKGRVSLGVWHQEINRVNMPRIAGDEIALYTNLYGTESPPAGGGNVAVRIRNNFIHEVSEAGPLRFESSDDWIMFGRRSDLETLANSPVGTMVDIILGSQPDWSDKKLVVAGGPTLLKNGRPFIDLEAQKFFALPPNNLRGRTAIGIRPNNTLFLMVVDHRPNGATLNDTAELLAIFDAKEGMNLDGGSSSQMVVKGDVRYASVGGNGAAVSTSLGFIPTGP